MTRSDRLQKLKVSLLSRRDELRRRSGKNYDSKSNNDSAIGDAADIAQYNEMSDLNSHLISMEADELSEIENALKKFHEDSYGICEVTGKPIPIARLEAMPLTRYSVEAQREAERQAMV
ncbi:TraR/DksA family transcriptional regulator [Rubinisphaera sp.]|uniref:TraR/DksA family transcriptional regulator n=1 Tax=Rubinisphaera sp. TaxID=2024857 RepID=UPI0025EC05E9|nr:TraR/DksA family transcriptional regulator [Rubinisphaera sp.]